MGLTVQWNRCEIVVVGVADTAVVGCLVRSRLLRRLVLSLLLSRQSAVLRGVTAYLRLMWSLDWRRVRTHRVGLFIVVVRACDCTVVWLLMSTALHDAIFGGIVAGCILSIQLLAQLVAAHIFPISGVSQTRLLVGILLILQINLVRP